MESNLAKTHESFGFSFHYHNNPKVAAQELNTSNRILLLGEPGAGKTSFINWISNYMNSVSYDERNRIYLEINPQPTKEIKEYLFRNKKGRLISIIDTPGFGTLDDSKYEQALRDTLKGKYLTAICVFIKSSTIRITPGFQLLLNLVERINQGRFKVFLMQSFSDNKGINEIYFQIPQLRNSKGYRYNFESLFPTDNSYLEDDFGKVIWERQVKVTDEFFDDLEKEVKQIFSAASVTEIDSNRSVLLYFGIGIAIVIIVLFIVL